ncbi:histone-fold-containing protein [Cokeromyces recurvatus]|uniref:histone-fold-containing protein n=1 Tax=Cokeromyces recurvatus TaxID=90255 RepID=UPI00221FAD37|nr:histone-fold-containing protein [Cokeromyces recurvatus]KAI7901840.1 histone-fold-containing protein [Cokeromyces recurvatus]
MTSQQHLQEEHQQQQHVQPPLPPHHQVYQQLNTTVSTSTAQPMFDLGKFWLDEMQKAEAYNSDFKNHALPLARIKKVMKTDQEVKMISAEAPILFAKGCEIFITELTKRAWVHAEENKRRTLQRSDIATAIAKTDMCDFLIDIVPREEAQKTSHAIYDQTTAYAAGAGNPSATATAAAAATSYYQSQYTNPVVPQSHPAGQMNPQTYYSALPHQFTNDQVQQYQMHLQQFAQQQPSQQATTTQQPSPQMHIKYETDQTKSGSNQP